MLFAHTPTQTRTQTQMTLKNTTITCVPDIQRMV